MEKRAKAKAKREARAAKKNQVEQRNVNLTQQDIQKKKDRASARKESKARKSVSPRASRKKSVARKSKKAASASSDDSSDDNAGEEIPMYDQRALLDKPYQTPSPAKVSPPLSMSPRLAPAPISDKSSGFAALSAKRKLLPEGKASASVKKAKSSVHAPIEEQKYEFVLMIDLIESVAYDAKSADLSILGVPDDVTKLVTKHFARLEEMTKELNQAVEDKKSPEQMRKDAITEVAFV